LTKGEKYVILKVEEKRKRSAMMERARFFLSSSKNLRLGGWSIIALRKRAILLLHLPGLFLLSLVGARG